MAARQPELVSPGNHFLNLASSEGPLSYDGPGEGWDLQLYWVQLLASEVKTDTLLCMEGKKEVGVDAGTLV